MQMTVALAFDTNQSNEDVTYNLSIGVQVGDIANGNLNPFCGFNPGVLLNVTIFR